MSRVSRNDKKKQTRQLLIESASRCFSKVGFEAATIDMISEEAGFSRGAFYSNFKTKDEILIELLKEHLESELITLEQLLIKVQTSDELIKKIQQRYRNLGQDTDWCLLSSEFSLYVMREGAQANQFKKLFNTYRLKLSRLIEQCCNRLNVDLKISPYELAISMLAISHGLSLQRVTNPSIRKSLVADALSIFIDGARKKQM